MRRRKRLPRELQPAFASFASVVEILEAAKSCLTDVVPTTRLPGRPLAEAVSEFEELLSRARTLMPAWRATELEGTWVAAMAGLEEASARARALREQAPDLGGFEGLIWTVERLMDPLGTFGDASRRFRDLRTSSK